MREPPTAPQPRVLVIPDELHGIRLGDYLPRRWPEVDRVFLRNLVLSGQTSVNGELASGLRHRLKSGDVLQVELPGPDASLPRYQAPAAATVPVVRYEDAEVLVVDKPAGLPATPDRSGKESGALGLLAAERPDDELRAIGRIDREASGCLLIAKSRAAWHRLKRDAAVSETWTALVVGELRGAEHRIERPLGPDPRRPGRVAVVGATDKGARAAATVVRTVASFRGFTLVEAVPETRRGHQVRVHLAHLGHPIVADRDYGRSRELLLSQIKRDYKARRGVVERPLLTRMFLHVGSLAFPSAEGPERVQAEFPDDLAIVLRKLESFARRR